MILVTLAVSGLVGVCAFWVADGFLVQQAERKVRGLLLSHRAMHLYIQRVMHPALYTLKSHSKVPAELYAPEILSSSYIVREQHQLYNEILHELGLEPIYYKMAADNPRNPINQADSKERQLIAFFNAQRERKEHREVIEQQGRKFLVVAIPFLENNQACLRCHGARADAPEQLQARYPSEGGFNETVGRIRAIESIRVPIATETGWAWVTSAMLLAGAAVFGGLVLTNRLLAGRVRERTKHLEAATADRQRAEEALRVTQFAVDTMSDAVYRIDCDGRILYANKASIQQLGYTCDEFLGGMTVLNLSERLTPERWQEVWQLIAGTGGHHTETTHRHRNGTSVPVEVHATYVKFGTDEFAWVVARDITERKQLEANFLQAQKMEAIGTLAGGIAHDFNNILAAVRGFADLAYEEIPPDCAGREDLHQIVLASDRARDLVKQILAFSRKNQRQKVPLQAGRIAKEALLLLHASLPSTIEIRQHLDLELWALADPTGLHQIIMNLCTNAFQAMRDTGGLLEVEFAAINESDSSLPANLPPGAWARLRVRDSGPGIASNALQHVFEPYFSTKPTSGGTGLGLSVVHGLVSGYGGMVTVQSELGQGSTFDVWLPRTAPSNERPSSKRPSAERGTERVLLVDDEESVRTIGSRQLIALGYSVRVASSAQEVLEILHADPSAFDLVVTDQTMPKLTGLALAAQLHERYPTLGILLMSGFNDAVQGRTAAQLGVDALITKPFTRHELGKAVREALAHLTEPPEGIN